VAHDRVGGRIGFGPREGADGVDQPAAGTKEIRGRRHDRHLQPSQTGERISARPPEQLGSSPGGADPRTRGVDEDPVERCAEGQPRGVLRNDGGVETQTVEGGRDQRGAIRVTVGGHDGALGADTTGEERRLAAGGGAGVEDPIAGARVQGLHDERRRLVLHREPALAPPGDRRWISSGEDQAVGMDGPDGRLESGGAERLDRVVDGHATAVDPEGERAALAEGERGPLDLAGRQEPSELVDRPR
jgi:hypothetical protein